MLKKGLIVSAGVLLGIGLLFGRSGWSYLTTSVDEIQQAVKDSIPVDRKLSVARHEIRNLDPEIRKAMHEIAKEEVQVGHLEERLDQFQTDLADNKEDIMTLKDALDTGKVSFQFAGRSYTARQVEADLTRRFANFKVKETTTDKLRQVLAARRKGLDAARAKLEEMLAAKKQLEIEVANLEAEHKMIEVAKAASQFNFDDSQLSRTRQLINEIKTQLEVEGKLANADIDVHEQIPLDEPLASDDISKEIAEYFGPIHNEYLGLK